MAAKVLPTNTSSSKNASHPGLAQLPSSLSGHVIVIYADNSIWDETANAHVLPETLTRLGK